MSDEAIVEFLKEILAEVEESLTSELPFSQEIFTRLILERLEEAGHLDGAFPLYEEGRVKNAAYRIDGYAHDEDRARIDLFSTIFAGDIPASKVPSSDVTKAVDRALRFASACIGGFAAQLEPANTDASDLARLIETESANLSTIRIVLLTDGIVGNISFPDTWRGKQLQVEVYDIVRLFRILGKGETRADIAVDLVSLTGNTLPCLHVPAENNEYDAYLAVLPGQVLSQVYDRYGVRLLELNVRAFLGLQGRKSVNSELRKTIADQPSMFLAYNNGIVATVDDLVVERSPAGGMEIHSLQGLQIVNGGQTTASLHRARRKESLNLDHVAVPVKIIKVGGADLSEMVASISRAANRQNTVQLADFSANDPFHQHVENLANTTWLDDGKGRWFYERARGAYLAAEHNAAYRKSDQKNFYQQTPKHRRLSKLDLARYLSAWVGLPDKVCFGGQKNFASFMQRLKDEPQPPPDQAWFKRLVAIAILYRAAEKRIRSLKLPAYSAQVTAYTVAALSHRSGGRIDFDRIWAKQAITAELEDMIANWAVDMNGILRRSAGEKNPSEWFKKGDCWKHVQEELPGLSDPLPPELSYCSSDGKVAMQMAPTHSVVDYERIAHCMQITSGMWMEVAEQGQKTGTIHWRVAGICRTLAGYAAGGWEKKPSAKQAKPALDAVAAVERAGLISKHNDELR